MRLLNIRVFAFLALVLASPALADDPPPRWWKGNLHTHTLWSDGNDFPEMTASWYRDNGYNFLALSDHNVLSQGVRWMPLAEIERRAGAAAFEKYLARYGEHWVERRDRDDGSTEVRLKPFDEYRALVEERGRFIMIQGEEITDRIGRIPIHINATNVGELIEPQHGTDFEDTIRNNLRAVEEQAERLGRPILPHINHPNFGWALTAEDIAAVTEERFFEVFNGHTSVHNRGDELRAGTDRMWDIMNTIRIAMLSAPPLFGLAVDDTHHYHGRSDVSIPGRGWVMVRARHLTPESIIRAMERGDFYASTGVTLRDVAFDRDAGVIEIDIEPEPGETYTTEFIGTREGFEDMSEPVFDEDGHEVRTTRRYSDDVGEVLARIEGTAARYELEGDELYVRAVITSSAAPDRATADNLLKKAWTQPVGWRERVEAATTDASDSIRAATFNIRYDNPADGPHAWSERRDRVIEVIESFNADVLGLQEVTPGQYDFLREHLPGYTFIGGGRDDGDRRGEASPILFRTDRFELLDHGMWWLSDTPSEPGSRGWDAALPRIATRATLRDRRTNEELLVVCTHFDHRGQKAREESAAFLAQALVDTPRVLLLGDFNALPGSTPHETLCSIFTDVAGENDAATWTGWDGEPDPGRRIDWVLIKGLEAARYRVDPWRTPDRPESDHLPVIVEVR